jgi:DNA polymerase-3 subunit alpha
MRASALACRSYFSLLRAAVSPQRWVETAKQLGYGAIALTDTNALYGIVEFYKAAQQAAIKPILGAEILTDTQRAFLSSKTGRVTKICAE